MRKRVRPLIACVLLLFSCVCISGCQESLSMGGTIMRGSDACILEIMDDAMKVRGIDEGEVAFFEREIILDFRDKPDRLEQFQVGDRVHFGYLTYVGDDEVPNYVENVSTIYLLPQPTSETIQIPILEPK